MLSSTVLTIGTALSRARERHARVDVLIQGQWVSGDVLAIDGHGAVLEDGETNAVIKLEEVSAVKVHSVPGSDLVEDAEPVTEPAGRRGRFGDPRVRAHRAAGDVRALNAAGTA